MQYDATTQAIFDNWNTAEDAMADLRNEAIEIVKIYQDKGYDVIRVVDHEYEAREYWNILDGNDGETLKGRITYRSDRGVLVTWHTEMKKA